MRNVCSTDRIQAPGRSARAISLFPGSLAAACAATLLIAATSCSFSQRDSSRSLVRFEIAARAPGGPSASLAKRSTSTFAAGRVAGIPSTVDEFDCYVVNVTGEGITPEAYSNSGQACSDLGVTSDLVSAATGGVIELEIPSGAERTVQLIGVKSDIGCPAGVSLATLLLGDPGSSFTGLYEIGRTKQDIFADSTVELSNSYDAASPVDALSCAVPEAPSITSVSPAYGEIAGGTTVRITGVGFRKSAQAALGDVACATTTFQSSTALDCVAGQATTEGSVELRVTHPGAAGSSVGTLANAFYFFAPLTASPSSATVEAGGTQSVTISGGVPPYTASIASGLGSVAANASSSRVFDFTSSTTTAGSSTVRVVDARSVAADVALTTVVTRATELALSAPSSTLRVGSCSEAFTVTASNSGHTAVAASTALTVTPSDSIGTLFYSDSSCVTAVSTLTIPAGSGSTTFYAKPTTSSSSDSIQVAAAGITSASATVTIAANAAALALAAPSSLSSGSCTSVTLSLLNSSGASVAAFAPVTATLAVTSSVGSTTGAALALYASSSCSGSQITSASIGTGSSSTVFYATSTYAQSAAIQASHASLTGSTTSITVGAGTPAALNLAYTGSTADATNPTVGACVGAFELRLADSHGSATTATTATPVSLSALPIPTYYASSSGFFTSSTCSGSAQYTVTIASGSSSQSLYFKTTDPGAVTLQASASSALTTGTLALTYQAGALSALTLSSGSSIGMAGSCAGAFTLNLRDSAGNNANLTSATSITLADSGSGQFYADSGCGTTVAALTFAASSTPAQTFYYKNTTSGYVTFGATSSAVSSTLATFLVRAATRSALMASALTSVTSNACSSAITVVGLDGYGNHAPPASPGESVTTSLSGSGTFYTDSSCAYSTSSVTHSYADPRPNFYFRVSGSGGSTTSITLSAASLTSYTLTGITIQTPPPALLSVTGAAGALVAGVCSTSPFTVSVMDSQNNATSATTTLNATLSGAGTGGLFYTNSACTNSTAILTISSGLSMGTFYFMRTAAGNANLSAAYGTLSSSGYSVSISPGAQSSITLAGSTSLTAGLCSGAITLNVMDAYGNESPSTSMTITLSGTTSGYLYGNSSCTGSILSAVTLASGVSSASIFYRNTVPETVTLTGSYYSLNPYPLTITVSAASPAALAWNAGTTQQVAGSCGGPFTVLTRDAYGNNSGVGANTTITLSVGTGSFYSNGSCSTPISTVSLASGAYEATTYYKATYTGYPSLVSQASGLTSSTLSVTVNPAAASSLTLVGRSSWITNTCSPSYTLRSRDSYGNSSPVSTATAITLLPSTSGTNYMSFYTDSGCSTSAGTVVTITSGNSSTYVYTKDPNVQTVTLGTNSSLGQANEIAVTYGLSLSVSPVSTTLTAGNSTTFTAVDGLPPASFTIQGSGSVGSINASSGYYTSPNVAGSYTITATDSYGYAAYATIVVNPQLQISPSGLGGISISDNDRLTFTSTGGTGNIGFTVSSGSGQISITGGTYTPSSNTFGSSTEIVTASDSLGNTSSATLTVTRLRRLAGIASQTPDSTAFCSIGPSGVVKCWGGGGYGELGYGDTGPTFTRGDNAGEMGANLPAVNLGVNRLALEMAGTLNSFCAVRDDGRPVCWGLNSLGQLGAGDAVTRGDGPAEMGEYLIPVNVGSGRTVAKLSAGNEHVCAIKDNGRVACWGNGYYGQLGTESSNTLIGDGPSEMGDYLGEANLGTNRTAVAIASGEKHNCAILDDGTLKCWGLAIAGGLGYGDTTNRGLALYTMGNCLPTVQIGTGRTVVQISAAKASNCAVLDNGTLKCWGSNNYGNLGYGDVSTRGTGTGQMNANLPAVNLGTNRTVVSVSTGGYSTCAILDNGQLKCWGSNFSSNSVLGYGDTITRGDGPYEMGNNLPDIDLGSNRTAKTVHVRASSTCVLLDNLYVKCFGYNNTGQLGMGDTSTRGNAPYQMGNNLPYLDL